MKKKEKEKEPNSNLVTKIQEQKKSGVKEKRILLKFCIRCKARIPRCDEFCADCYRSECIED